MNKLLSSSTSNGGGIIKITNSFSHLLNVDSMILDGLSKKMTFYRPSYEYLFARARGKNLGFMPKETFITSKGKFATGLLPLVTEYLQNANVPFTRVDYREPLPQLYKNWDYSVKLPKQQEEEEVEVEQVEVEDGKKRKKSSKSKKKKKKSIVDEEEPIRLFDLQPDDLESKSIDNNILGPDILLHDYQVESVNFALQNHRGIIKCATGGGKTLILASLIKAIGNDVNTVILVTKRSLVNQIYNSLKDSGVCDPGRISSDYHDPKTITISTLQSTHKIEQICKDAKVLLVDEVHEFANKSSKEAFKLFSNAYARFGFSATPFRSENQVANHQITSVFGTLLCDITTKALMEINILSQAKIHFYPMNYPNLKETKKLDYAEVEDRLVADNEYLNQSIVKLVDSIPNGRIMILVKRISHGDELHKLIPNAYWVSGCDSLETREYVIEKLKHEKNEKVVAIFSTIGNVGIDVKIHHLINACGGKDPNLTLQKLGRGLRKADDKLYLDYHDFYYSAQVHKHLQKHSSERVGILKKEGHSVEFENELLDIKDFIPESNDINEYVQSKIKKKKQEVVVGQSD